MPKLNPKLNNRKKVAQRLIEQIISGKEKINQTKALTDSGYSPITANCKSGLIVKSKECQEELVKFEDQLEELIQNNIKHAKKTQQKATFRDSTDAIDKMAKLKALITGSHATESITVKWE